MTEQQSALGRARALAACENTIDLRQCMPAIMRSLPDDMILMLALGYMQEALRALVQAHDLERSAEQ